jgi:hypothetical protein
MSPSRFNLPEKSVLIHWAIGGVICILSMFLLRGLVFTVLEEILVYFGLLGAVFFEETSVFAATAFSFGIVYLTAGFCGGLYTGYNIDENLKIFLAIPGIIGFTALTIALYFFGDLASLNISLVGDIFLPFLGSLIGSYLGGYAMNWPTKEEEEYF